MHLDSLRVFCDVVQQRSFSKGAAANDVTQSAASQIVRQLERHVGSRLIDRSTRPLQLTAAGRVYYEGCRDLIDRYAEIVAGVRRAQADLAGIVRVAAIYSVGLGDMGQQVERFQAAHAQVQVQVEYLHPDRVYERIGEGTADLGLVSFPRRVRGLVAHPWREEEMVVVCPPRHPLARARSVRPAQLAGEKFIGFDRGLVVRREVDRFLREHGAAVQVVMEFDNVETIKKAIEVSAGIALLPAPTLRQEVEAGTLVAVPLAGKRFVRPLGIIQRRQHKPSPAARKFMELLRGKSPRTRENGPVRPRNGQPPIGPGGS